MDRALVSPGISLDEPALVAARENGVELIGDLELFLQHAKAPVIGITGSNGKSTVTTLLEPWQKLAALMLAWGVIWACPCWISLMTSMSSIVLELSSFQLELLNDSRGAIVALLNVSPDHMDRYQGLQQYHAAKHRIFRGASRW